VVHRDVKPGNVLVTPAGQVKVADFGIARAITASTDENLTQVGTVMGTATYFSPEQARGEPVDPRSDIYSLGCVLYELVVGRPPFAGDSPVAIAYKHVQESPVPPRQINPELPAAIEAIILKCLAKNPVNRYPSAEDLRADLRRFREGSGILAEPVMPVPVDATTAVPITDDLEEDDDEPRRSSGLFIAALVILLLLLGLSLFFLSRQLLGDDDGDAVPQVEVPNVIDRPIAEAQAILERENLEVSIVQEANDDTPEGIVFAQDPVRGEKVDEGSTVELKVSSGSAATAVPNVVGSQIEQALLTLSGQGFTNVRQEPTVDEAAPVGEVVDQDPGPDDEVPTDTEIVLFVSSGPADRPVPDVVGRPVAEASNLLGQAGFQVSQRSEPSSTIDEGVVIRTDPPADSVQPKGATIVVVVSSGPAEANVPSVEGLTEAVAIDRLRSAGFNPVVEEQDTEDAAQNGRVISQDPGANSTAIAGSDVRIVVGRLVSPPPTEPDP
jgi:beta-lactam-binding protein with PASTA domain